MEPREFTALLEPIGSWTVLYVPFDVKEAFSNRGGFIKVKGSIDGHPIAGLNLMPLSEQHRPEAGITHLLAVKAGIRKAIGKKAGSTVQVVLEPDLSGLTIPEDFAATLDLLPDAKAFFGGLTESQRGYFVKWIVEARTLETRHSRIEKCIGKLEARKKFYDA